MFNVHPLAWIPVVSMIWLAFITITIERFRPQEISLRDWSTGATLLASALMLMALHGVIPNFFSIGVAHSLIIFGIGFIHVGTRKFFNLGTGRPWHWFAGGIVFIISLIFIYLVPSIPTVISATSIIQIPFFGACAWWFWHNADSQLKLFERLTALFFAGGGLLLLYRVGMVFFAIELLNEAPNSAIFGGHFIYSILFGIWLSVTLTLLITMRLQKKFTEACEHVAVVSDELRKASTLIEELAHVDILTGDWNRRQFHQMVVKEIDRSKRYGYPLTLLLLDVDHFKKINEKYGHAEGDRVLRQVADDVRGTLRLSDSLTRWGEDEFIVLMSNTGLANAAILAKRIREHIIAHPVSGIGVVTVSMGIAEYHSSDFLEQWLERANNAMCQAKNGGRNRIEIDAMEASPGLIVNRIGGGLVQMIWQDCFLSGHPIIDGQHRGLIDNANQLLSAILAERPNNELSAYIDNLVRDIIQHFKDEEAILTAIGYPDIAEHEACHRDLINRAVVLVDRFYGGTLMLGELFQFLAYHVVAKHMLIEDRKFFRALRLEFPFF